MRHSVGRRPGYTLLETILAVSLSALLIGLIGSGLRVYSQLVASRRADVANAQLARVVFQRISKDIRAAYIVSNDEEQGGTSDVGIGLGSDGDDTGSSDLSAGTSDGASDATLDLTGASAQPSPGVYGNATELQLDVFGSYVQPIKYDTLLEAGLDPQSTNMWSVPMVVTIYLRTADASELAGTPLEPLGDDANQSRLVLVRRVQSRAEATFASTQGTSTDFQVGEQILSDQVRTMAFSYFDGYDWVDSWDSSIDGGLPLAIRIEAEISAVPATESSGTSDEVPSELYRVTVHLPTAEFVEQTTGL